MSYTISSSQARLFGFTPKYAWEEFRSSHSDLSGRILRDTIGDFLSMSESEGNISRKSQEILKSGGVDAKLYCMRAKRSKRKREQMVAEEMEYSEGRRVRSRRSNSDEEDEVEMPLVSKRWTGEEENLEEVIKKDWEECQELGESTDSFLREVLKTLKDIRTDRDRLKALVGVVEVKSKCSYIV